MAKPIRGVLLTALVLALYFGGRYLYFKPLHEGGDPAPPLRATLLDGSAFDLTALHGEYVLLDFWGSWCGPCLQDYPKLVELHKQYGSSGFDDAGGFEIVSIAIEEDVARWHKAIGLLDPPWSYQILDQTSSLRFFNGEIAEAYGVRQLPTKFLIGPEGQVIASDWSLVKIDKYLSQKVKRG